MTAICSRKAKEIPGRLWHPDEKAWSVPANSEAIQTLRLIGCIFSEEILQFEKSLCVSADKKCITILPAPLKVSPYAHQLEGYNLACRSMGIIGSDAKCPGFALLMEMGTGKTITAIAIAGRAYLEGKIKRLLIFAPKSIVAVWDEEFSKFAAFPYSLSVLIGSSAKKAEQLKAIKCTGLEIAVLNYDSAALLEKELLAWNPDFLICDESSKVKNPSSKMSKATHRIAKKCKSRELQYNLLSEHPQAQVYS